MSFVRIVILLILAYFILKVFRRLIAPFFEGYYQGGNAENTKKDSSNQQRVNNIVIDTSKAKSKLHSKPDINRVDAEDIDYEEVK